MAEILERVSGAFLKILELFRRPQLDPPPEPIEVPQAEEQPQQDKPPRFTESLGELLDHLDEAFTAYSIPTDIVLGYLDRDELTGLKKLGAHVPHPWVASFTPYGEEVKLNDWSNNAPAMMFIALTLGHYEMKDKSYPDFMFAIKQKKLPWYVEHKEGVPYKFGMGYRFNETNAKRMWWMGSWLVITPNGTIEFCKEMRVRNVFLKTGKNAGLAYSQKIKCYSELYESALEEHTDKGIHDLKNFFKSMYTWWTGRVLSWSVTVKKKGDRVTFSIDRTLTKKYFVDRNKVVDDKGRTKRIIHYVKEHERVRDEKKYLVKEHLRGLSKFQWKGYDCTVIAPEFNDLPTVMFNGAALELEEKDFVPGKFVQTSKIGLELAKAEDMRAKQ